jgi:hypothetical protein
VTKTMLRIGPHQLIGKGAPARTSWASGICPPMALGSGDLGHTDCVAEREAIKRQETGDTLATHWPKSGRAAVGPASVG